MRLSNGVWKAAGLGARVDQAGVWSQMVAIEIKYHFDYHFDQLNVFYKKCCLKVNCMAPSKTILTRELAVQVYEIQNKCKN